MKKEKVLPLPKIIAFHVTLVLLSYTKELTGYFLPNTINIGFTNIQGGAIGPTSGWYWDQYFNFRTSNKFLDNNGKPFGCVPGPRFNFFCGLTELIYQSPSISSLHARLGLDIQIFYIGSTIGKNEYGLLSDDELGVVKNSTGIRSSGVGFSDPYMGLFMQWDPIMRGDHTLFVHRLEFAVSFPAGKYKNGYFLNPGNGCYYINPNWSATLYMTPRLSLSTNLNYIWSSQKKYSGVQPGQAIFLNYSMEYECLKNFWLAVCGYYIGQYTYDKLYGVTIPNSKEQTFSIGPGLLYTVTDKIRLFSYFYFEKKTKNRAEGISFFLRSHYMF